MFRAAVLCTAYTPPGDRLGWQVQQRRPSTALSWAHQVAGTGSGPALAPPQHGRQAEQPSACQHQKASGSRGVQSVPGTRGSRARYGSAMRPPFSTPTSLHQMSLELGPGLVRGEGEAVPGDRAGDSCAGLSPWASAPDAAMPMALPRVVLPRRLGSARDVSESPM